MIETRIFYGLRAMHCALDRESRLWINLDGFGRSIGAVTPTVLRARGLTQEGIEEARPGDRRASSVSYHARRTINASSAIKATCASGT